jgi:peptide/nickel transport system permease protein
MGRFLLRRLVNYLVLVTVATTLGYFLAASSLNPRANFQGRNPPPPPAAVNASLDALNMNDQTPITQRYATWAAGVLHGDFGRTIDNDSVNAEMGRRIGVSLRLLLLGTVFGCALGVLLGALGAVRQYRLSDHTLTVTSFLVLSIPVPVLAVLLTLGAVKLNAWTGVTIFEYTGEFAPEITGTWPRFVDRLQHLVLPTLTIALAEIAIFSRYQRSAMLDVLGSDFVRTAMAKGLRRRTALLKHALRTALIPSATYFAYSFGLLLTGATLTEKIFAWHGMGEWLVDSITRNDVNAVASVTMFAAVLVLLAGLLSDVLYAVLDPRVRVG